MTIRHLKIFIAVCENGSITKAAEILHIAQPAVSFTISEIEKYYKVIYRNLPINILLTAFFFLDYYAIMSQNTDNTKAC